MRTENNTSPTTAPADLSAVRAAIQRQREVETSATPGPWRIRQPWAGFSTIQHGEELCYHTAAPSFPRAAEDHAETVEARNSHALLLDIAEAAAELREAVGISLGGFGGRQIDWQALIAKLDAALARLTEER